MLTKPHVTGWRQTSSPITLPGYRKGQRPPNYGMKLPPEPLDRGEIARLLATFGGGAAAARNKALIVLLWRTGLRISEALALYPKDVDWQGGRLTVLKGKGGKRRTVAVDEYALAMLRAWMAHRRRLALGGQHAIFCTVNRQTRGRAMSSAYVRTMLKKRARAAGIAKRVHPHGFRHTCAFELISENTPLGVIRAQLGHSHLATTMGYCDHLLPEAAIRYMLERPLPEL